MTRAEVDRLSAYVTDHAHMCRCDEPVLDDRFSGYCSEECLDAAIDHAHERQMEEFYGGSSPFTLAEQHEAAWREKRGYS